MSMGEGEHEEPENSGEAVVSDQVGADDEKVLGDEEEMETQQTNPLGGSGASDQRTRPAPRFERAAPLPTRVRDGSLEEEYLEAGGERIPWSSVRYISLGIIDQMVKDSELKKGPLRKMMQKVTGGEDNNSAKDRAKQVREVFLLDVFTDVQGQPFRFEAGNINYKSFLDRVGYVSHHNFFRFCVHLARRVPHALATQSYASFLGKRRDKVTHFPDFHDFELETDQQLRFARDVVLLSEVDLSNDSWVDEWSENDE